MKTVKVRIAVAVDPNGKARYWIEAELAVPEPTVLQGEVSDA